MGSFAKVVDVGLGYLGLLLIGAISWTADRWPSAGRPQPGVPTRVVSHSQGATGRAMRPGISPATTPRSGG